MAQAGKDASPAGGVVRYARHRPETTLLYQLVDEYYPAFADQIAARGTPLLVAQQQPGFDFYFRHCQRSSRVDKLRRKDEDTRFPG